MTETTWVRQAEAARQLGISRERVRQLVRAGALALVDGRIDLAAALAWKEARDPKKVVAADLLDEGFDDDEDGGGFAPEPLAVPGSPPGRGGSLTDEYKRVSIKLRMIQASDAQLDLDKKAGRLVERAGVELAVAELGQVVRNELSALPRDFSERLAAEADPTEVRRLLTAWVDGVFKAFERGDPFAVRSDAASSDDGDAE